MKQDEGGAWMRGEITGHKIRGGQWIPVDVGGTYCGFAKFASLDA
jgi:hypothetical protein